MAVSVVVEFGDFLAANLRLGFNTESLALERDLLRLLPWVTPGDHPSNALLLGGDDALHADARPEGL